MTQRGNHLHTKTKQLLIKENPFNGVLVDAICLSDFFHSQYHYIHIPQPEPTQDLARMK